MMVSYPSGYSQVTTNPIATSITSVAARLLPNDPRRIRWVVVSLDNADAYLWFDSAVSATRGLPMGGRFSGWESSWDEDGRQVQQEVWGIAPNGTVAVIVLDTAGLPTEGR